MNVSSVSGEQIAKDSRGSFRVNILGYYRVLDTKMRVKTLTPCGLKMLPPEGEQGIKAKFPWVGKKIRISREGLSIRNGTFSFSWLKDRSNSSVKAILDSCGVSYFLASWSL